MLWTMTKRLIKISLEENNKGCSLVSNRRACVESTGPSVSPLRISALPETVQNIGTE